MRARRASSPGQLTIHADRGTSMTSKPVALLLADLGVTKTHSRPHVSNDNPFSEAHFKTLKYRPDFPERFGCIEDARASLRRLLRLVQRRASPQRARASARRTTSTTASPPPASPSREPSSPPPSAAHPERFLRGVPARRRCPTAVWINKPDAGCLDRSRSTH